MTQSMKMLSPFKVGVIVRSIAERLNYGLTLHNVPKHWAESKGDGVTVSVIDTGVPVHRDIKVMDSANFTNDNKFDRIQGHSTHVSGIICASPGGGDGGLIGLAPECNLIIAKALDDKGVGSDESLSRSIFWSIDSGADIINMSLGAPYKYTKFFPKTLRAVQTAARNGIIMVCASGNENASRVNIPGLWPNTITVGAVNSSRELAWFSNKGRHIDFAAAGVNILSTYKKDTYAELSGTSMAAPHITGICALILSYHKKASHSYTPIVNSDQMVEHLRRITMDFGDTGFDQAFGWGIPVFGHINPDAPRSNTAANEKPVKGYSILDTAVLCVSKILKK